MREDRPFARPRRMIAQGVTVSKGRRYVVCVDPTTAEVVQAAIASQGGGNCFVQWPVNTPRNPGSAFAISPEDTGAAEVWVLFDRDRTPIVVSTTSPNLSAWLEEKAPDLLDGNDHPGTFGPQDLVLANGDGVDEPSSIIVGADRSINLLANGSVRIQVPDDYTVRVYRNGESGSAVVRFEPTQEAFNVLVDEINKLSTAVSNLYTLTGLIEGGAVVNPVRGVSYSSPPLPAVGEEIASKTLFVPYDDESDLI